MFMIDGNLYERLTSLPKEEIVKIMYDAIELMQQYNGQSVDRCIVTALKSYEQERNE